MVLSGARQVCSYARVSRLVIRGERDTKRERSKSHVPYIFLFSFFPSPPAPCLTGETQDSFTLCVTRPSPPRRLTRYGQNVSVRITLGRKSQPRDGLLVDGVIERDQLTLLFCAWSVFVFAWNREPQVRRTLRNPRDQLWGVWGCLGVGNAVRITNAGNGTIIFSKMGKQDRS